MLVLTYIGGATSASAGGAVSTGLERDYGITATYELRAHTDAPAEPASQQDQWPLLAVAGSGCGTTRGNAAWLR